MFVAGHFVVDKLISDPKCSAIIAELFDVAFFVIRYRRSLTFEGLTNFRTDELRIKKEKKLLITQCNLFGLHWVA